MSVNAQSKGEQANKGEKRLAEEWTKAQKQPRLTGGGGHQKSHLLNVTFEVDMTKKPRKWTFFKRFLNGHLLSSATTFLV